MLSTPELVAAVQRDRERDIERHRLAVLASCVRSCCSPSLVTRVVRTLRLQPGSC